MNVMFHEVAVSLFFADEGGKRHDYHSHGSADVL